MPHQIAGSLEKRVPTTSFFFLSFQQFRSRPPLRTLICISFLLSSVFYTACTIYSLKEYLRCNSFFFLTTRLLLTIACKYALVKWSKLASETCCTVGIWEPVFVICDSTIAYYKFFRILAKKYQGNNIMYIIWLLLKKKKQ